MATVGRGRHCAGVGRGDIVPARLEPGEGVFSKVMEGLTNRAKFGDTKGGGHIHVHHRASYTVQAFNSSGVDQVLRDHGGQVHSTRG
jgi:hypothetical protein